MISLVHVARTYWRRPRFWIFGALYLLLTFWAAAAAADSPVARLGLLSSFLMLSNLFAGVLISLVALHVRRQFGNARAKLSPGYAAPHWFVAAMVTLLIWWLVPSAEAAYLGFSPVTMIAAHVLVPILLAGVIYWPTAIVLLATVPLMLPALTSSADKHPAVAQFFKQFATGETGWTYALLIGLGLAALPLAAWRLTRLSDTTAASSDDFTIEPLGSAAGKNPLSEFFRRLRDAAIESRLARRSWWTAFGHRRVPGTFSWFDIGLFGAIVLALMPIFWWLSRDQASAWIIMTGGTGLMLFAPFGFWRFRSSALATEYMLPATRRRMVRQVVAAMAADFAAWATVASAVIVLGYVMLMSRDGLSANGIHSALYPNLISVSVAISLHVVILWVMATLLFGIGLATLRFRFWMPPFVGCLIVSVVAGLVAMRLVSHSLHKRTVYWDWTDGLLVTASFVGTEIMIGLALGWFSYRRWLEMDLK